MKLCVYKIEKESIKGKKEISYLCGRDINKKKIIIKLNGHEPYLYVNPNQAIPSDKRIKRIEEGFEEFTHKIKNLKKLIVYNSFDVYKSSDNTGVRTLFDLGTTYEDDIFYINRVFIDSGIKCAIEIPDGKDEIDLSEIKIIEDFFVGFRIVLCDIETLMDTKNKIPDKLKASNRLTCLSLFDIYTLKGTTFINREDLSKKKYKNLLKTKSGSKYEWQILTFSDEKEMLLKFLEYYEHISPDIFSGYNARNFDFPYMINRMKNLKIDITRLSPLGIVYFDGRQYVVKGVVLFDTLLGYRKMQLKEGSFKLEDVAQKVLGYGKVKHSSSLNDLYYEKIQKLAYYNAIDVILDYEISKKEDVFEIFRELVEYVGLPYGDTYSDSKLVDTLYLRKAKKIGLVLPSSRKVKKEKYKGAVVFTPKRFGIEEFMMLLDLKSMYVNIIMAFNIGLDTILKEYKEGCIKTPNPNFYFSSEEDAFVVSVIIELMEYRDSIKDELKRLQKSLEDDKLKGKISEEEIKEREYEIDKTHRKQYVIKYILLCIYGTLGFTKFRFYDKELAGLITFIERFIINDSRRVCEDNGWEVYYGDTDSLFVLCKSDNLEDAIREGEELANILNFHYQTYTSTYNLIHNELTIKLEKVFGVFGMLPLKGSEEEAAKKKYFGKMLYDEGVIIKEGKIYSKGLEKSDMTIVCIKLINKIVENTCYDRSKPKVKSFVKEIVVNIRNFKYLIKDISLSKRMRGTFNDYFGVNKLGHKKTPPEFVRAGLWTNEHAHLWGGSANIGRGSRIFYVYVKPGDIPNKYSKTDILALDDNDFLPEELIKCIDFNKLIEKTIKDKIEQFLYILNIKYSNIISGKETRKLVKFA